MRHEVFLGGLLAVLLGMGCGGGGANRPTAGAMPQGGTFTGVWFSPQYGEMHMLETGATVVGRYEKGERKGRIQGHITGDLLHFQWTEKRELIVGRPSETIGHGYFRIVHDDAEDVFKIIGEWGHDDAEQGGGPWNAVKSNKLRPDVGSGGSASPAAATGSGGGSNFEQESDDWAEEEESYDDDLGDL